MTQPLDPAPLKPCPKCKSARVSYTDDSVSLAWVECLDCGHEGPKAGPGSTQSAEELWNEAATPLADRTLRDVQAQMRALWGEEQPDFADICVALGVVQGDLCRASRDGGWKRDAMRELGNLVLSSLRAVDTLGLSVDECLSAAEAVQRVYVEQRNEPSTCAEAVPES